MAREQSELTNAQWEKIAPLLPAPKSLPRGGPKPIPNRPVFEGILWILRSGARWQDLPARFPSSSTCWRRLRAWEAQGVWLEAWRVSWPNWMPKANSTGLRRLLTAALPQRKKGSLRREDQA